jgi:hypothetical protein
VNWLRGTGRSPPLDTPASRAPVAGPTEGAAPGVAALLEGASEGRSRAVLDLGTATDTSLRAYGRFARWIRFADLLGDANWPRPDGSTADVFETMLVQPDHPYDLVFAWDVLDRLFPEQRPRLLQRLAEITAPDARLHAIVRSSQETLTFPLRFTLLEVGRIRYEPAGTFALPGPRLLPAEVAKVLAPFRVAHAFTLKSGLREYVAVRPNA